MRAWVTALLTAVSLCLAPWFAAQAERMDRLELHCPDNSDPDIVALCAVLRERLARNGTGVTDRGGDVVAHLQGHGLKGPGLVARLVVMRAGQRHVSPELTLTAMDRRGIPLARLRCFADDLIARLAPSQD